MVAAAKRIDVTEDLVPIGHFKTHASEHIRRIHATGRPMVITQNGRAAAVVLTPADFEELGHRAFARAKIDAGLRSAETAPTYTPAEVEAHLLAKIRSAARRAAPAQAAAGAPAKRSRAASGRRGAATSDHAATPTASPVAAAPSVEERPARARAPRKA